MDPALMLRIFTALSHPMRLQIYLALLGAENGLTRAELLCATKTSKAALTIYLDALVNAHLAKIESMSRVLGDNSSDVRGQFRCYALTGPVEQALAAFRPAHPQQEKREKTPAREPIGGRLAV